MNHAVEMGSGAAIHMTNFIKICSGIQTLLGADTHTDTRPHGQQGDLITIHLLFFKIRKLG
jgi:hypothetical protein